MLRPIIQFKFLLKSMLYALCICIGKLYYGVFDSSNFDKINQSMRLAL